jgi:pilus assembly protein CpaE
MASQDRIKVLIVDDIAETREMIQRMLQFDLGIEVVGSARTGREAIELTEKLKPDVAIMDINMPDMDGITATESIRKKVPFVQVVILSVQNDPNYMRRAMLAGARDFLTKPPMIDDLTSAIKRAGAMAQEERKKTASSYPGGGAGGSTSGLRGGVKGKIIVVYSPKGGNGSTTIATNLALALHSAETETILVDGSLQFGDVAVFLNEQGKNSVMDLTPRVEELDPEVVKEVAVQHPNSGLRLLIAPPSPELADKVSGEQFGKLLQYLKLVFSYVVVDTSSYLTDVVMAAIDVSDVIVLITTQDIPSVKNANLFLNLLKMMGISQDRVLFVMNRFDKRIAITPEKVGESLKTKIALTIPFEERTVSDSVNRGVPIILENRTSPVSKSILSLMDLIKEKVTKTDAAADGPVKK